VADLSRLDQRCPFPPVLITVGGKLGGNG
jgi:hypothetical protein